MKKEKEKKKEIFNGGGRIRSRGLWITNLAPYHWATETTYNHIRYKICIYIQYGVSDHTTFDLCNPTISILIKKKPYQMHNKSGECGEFAKIPKPEHNSQTPS